MTPFEIVESGDLVAVNSYIAEGGPLDIQCVDSSESLLSTAVNCKNSEIVKILLYAGADPNFSQTLSVPLITAAGWQQIEIVDLLVQHGANIEMPGEDGITALMAAASAGSLATVERLLAAGARPKQRDLSGDTAIIAAAEKNHKEIVERLQPLSSPKDKNKAEMIINLNEQGPPSEEIEELIRMAGFGALPVVKGWIEDDGLHVDSIDEKGTTALMSASLKGSLKVVKYLIEKGADVNRKDIYGDYALALAAGACQVDAFDFLYPLTNKRLLRRAEKIKREEIEYGNWPSEND